MIRDSLPSRFHESKRRRERESRRHQLSSSGMVVKGRIKFEKEMTRILGLEDKRVSGVEKKKVVYSSRWGDVAVVEVLLRSSRKTAGRLSDLG